MALEQLNRYNGTAPSRDTQTKEEMSTNIQSFHTYLQSYELTLNPLINKINTIFSEIGNKLLYTNYKGDFNIGTTYAVGESVSESGVVYFSKVSSNIGNTPPSAEWIVASISSVGDAVNNSYDNTTSGLDATNAQAAVDELSSATGGVNDFVASGAVTAGDVVALNNDGTVSVIQELITASSNSIAVNTTAIKPNICSVGNNKYVVAVNDDTTNDEMSAYVITYNQATNTISSGAKVTIFSHVLNDGHPSVTYNKSEDCVLFVFGNDAVAATINGTSLSLGTPLILSSALTGNGIQECSFYHNDGYHLLFTEFSNDMAIGILSIVGTTITEESIATNIVDFPDNNVIASYSVAYDSIENRFMLAYYNDLLNRSEAIIGSLSGTTITWGGKTTLSSSGSAFDMVSAYYSAEIDRIIVFTDADQTLKVCNITSNSNAFTSGTPLVLSVNTSINGIISDNPFKNQVSLIGRCKNTYLNEIFFDIDTATETITQNTTNVLVSNAVKFGVNGFITSYDNISDRNYVLYIDSSNDVSTVVSSGADSTNTDWIGISQNTVADAQTLTATMLGGINENQSALTAGTQYFANTDGTLTTTDTGYPVGTALSSTKLIVEGNA